MTKIDSHAEKLESAKRYLAANPPAKPVVIGVACDNWPNNEKCYKSLKECPR